MYVVAALEFLAIVGLYCPCMLHQNLPWLAETTPTSAGIIVKVSYSGFLITNERLMFGSHTLLRRCLWVQHFIFVRVDGVQPPGTAATYYLLDSKHIHATSISPKWELNTLP